MAVVVTTSEGELVEALARSANPLIVCDIDEVVLEFVAPFMAFLDSHGHEWRTQSFRLTGNVYARNAAEPIDAQSVSAFRERFFGEHDTWQGPVDGALDALAGLAAAHGADIVFLTSMSPRHHSRRRTLLDAHGFAHPMISTEAAKGEAVASLMRHHPRKPVAFIDDLPSNHLSVLEAVPDALALQFMAYAPLRALLPPLPAGVTAVNDWMEAADAIAAHFRKRRGG